MNKRICNIRNRWLGVVLSLVLCLALVFSLVPPMANGSASADEEGRDYPVMRPDRETLEEWIEAYNNAPRAYIEPEGFEAAAFGGSKDLLSYLEYIPDDRDQGSCGDCWAWAGTGCLEVALDVQEEIRDRLSVQYINSNYNGGSGDNYACCGGWLSYLADFYDPPGGTGMCIPWYNINASWQDGSQQCGQSTTVPGGSISTDPNYPISSIDDVTIDTQNVTQAEAINNIKYQLNDNKAVWFGFFLPNSSAWTGPNGFKTFWGSSGESIVYDMDQFCGQFYNPAPGEGGGHAVLCVGYDDTNPDKSYWIMLNSWGTRPLRPHGLFRIDTDMNYGGQNPGLGGDYSFYWQTLDVAFGGMPDISVPPTVSTDEATSVEETTTTLNGTLSNDGGEACQYRFQYDTNSGEPYAYNTWWTGSKTSGQSFSAAISGLSKGTKYYFRAQAKNNAGTSSGSELTFLTKPDSPSSFSATSAGTTQIGLSWTKGAGAQKTKIQRKQGSYPANKDDGTQVYFGTGTSTPDTGLSPGTTYYYRAWSYIQGSEQWSDNYAQAQATTAGAQPDVPDITISPPSFVESGPPGTSWTRTLTIGNVGNAELNYTLSDTETTGGASTGKAENLLLKPANMALGLPLEGSPIEPENTPEGGNGWQNIMTDGFEGAFPSPKWQLYGDPTWGKESYRRHEGSYSAWCAGSGYNPPSNYPNNMEAWMIYGPFSLADATDAELNFWFWNKSQGPDDYLFWGASTGGWFYGSRHDGDSAGWQSVSFDLTDVYTLGNLCGQTQVWIGFSFASDESTTDEGAFIDDVALRKYVGGAPEDCPWLDEEPKSGSVAPGGHDDITVTYDTTGRGSTYTANITITSNDPDEPQVTVPVTLTVTTGVSPSVSIEPPSQTVPPGGAFNVDVWLDAVGRNLNGIAVAVQYDSNVMTTSVAHVEGHNLLGGLEIPAAVNEAAGVGEVTYSLASGTAVGGIDASVMTITFTMDAGAAPATYDLTVSRGTLIEPPDATEIAGVETNDGTVTVGIGRKGDFNGDGAIDIFDFVLFAAVYGT